MKERILILSVNNRIGEENDRICNRFISGAVEAGNQVERISLRDSSIRCCRGCSKCSQGSSVHRKNNRVECILGKMELADVLIVVIPTNQEKANQGMERIADWIYLKNHALSFKKAVLMLPEGKQVQQDMQRMVGEFERFVDCLGKAEEVSVIYASETEMHKERNTAWEAYRLGRSI